jgi:hypothetical protein
LSLWTWWSFARSHRMSRSWSHSWSTWSLIQEMTFHILAATFHSLANVL